MIEASKPQEVIATPNTVYHMSEISGVQIRKQMRFTIERVGNSSYRASTHDLGRHLTRGDCCPANAIMRIVDEALEAVEAVPAKATSEAELFFADVVNEYLQRVKP